MRRKVLLAREAGSVVNISQLSAAGPATCANRAAAMRFQEMKTASILISLGGTPKRSIDGGKSHSEDSEANQSNHPSGCSIVDAQGPPPRKFAAGQRKFCRDLDISVTLATRSDCAGSHWMETAGPPGVRRGGAPAPFSPAASQI